MKIFRVVLLGWSKILSFLLRWMVRLHVPLVIFEFVCLLLFVRPTARLMGRFSVFRTGEKKTASEYMPGDKVETSQKPVSGSSGAAIAAPEKPLVGFPEMHDQKRQILKDGILLSSDGFPSTRS